MKTLKIKIALLVLISIFAKVTSSSAQADVQIPKAQLKYIRANQLPTDLIIPRDRLTAITQQNIDLSAHAINFTVNRRIDQFKAVIKVEGVVKNIGRSKYESGAEQQAAYLYEDNGTGRLRLVAIKVFQNLNVGEEVKLAYMVTHSKSNEFPSAYVLVIGFDPDLYIDGNPKNDDGNTTNNKRTKRGELINDIVW